MGPLIMESNIVASGFQFHIMYYLSELLRGLGNCLIERSRFRELCSILLCSLTALSRLRMWIASEAERAAVCRLGFAESIFPNQCFLLERSLDRIHQEIDKKVRKSWACGSVARVQCLHWMSSISMCSLSLMLGSVLSELSRIRHGAFVEQEAASEGIRNRRVTRIRHLGPGLPPSPSAQ